MQTMYTAKTLPCVSNAQKLPHHNNVFVVVVLMSSTLFHTLFTT